MFFRICFWFCSMVLLTPTIEKMIFLSSTVAMVERKLVLFTKLRISERKAKLV